MVQASEALRAQVAQLDLGRQLPAKQLRACQREQYLPPIGERHNPLRTREGQVADVAPGSVLDRPSLRRTGMNPHAYFDRDGMPGLLVQRALRRQRGTQCIACRMERRAKGVADD